MTKTGKRARRLDLDMNMLGIASLQTIQATLDNELAHATEKGHKLSLLMWRTSVKCYIDERTGRIH
jgi:hypothetical protein